MNFNLSNFDWKSQSFLILFVAALSQFLGSLITNSVVVLLPDISKELLINVNILNWITLIFFMTTVACGIPLSKIINQYGVKKYTKIATFGLIIGLLLSAITVNTELFLLSRIIQGVTIAILYVSVYLMIVLGLGENETGKALGIIGSAGYVGMTIAPTLSGFIADLLSWRFTFILIIPVLVLQLIVLKYIKEEWQMEKTSIDTVGSILYVFLVIFLIYGLSEIKFNGYIFLIFFAIILIAFILYERKRESPLYNLKLLRDMRYVIGNYAAMASYFITFIATYVLNLYLQVVAGMEASTVGLLLFITPVIMVFLAPYAGKLSDNKDPRVLSAIAMGFLTVAMALMIFIGYLPFYMIILILVLQGIGHGLFSSPNNRYVITLVDIDNLADASAFMSAIKEFGKLVSLAIFNIISVMFIGNLPVGKNIAGLLQSSRWMMFITVLIALSSVILLLLSKYYYEREENPEVIALLKRLVPKWLKDYFDDVSGNKF